MTPPALHRPSHHCLNYPTCKKTSSRTRHSDGSRTRSDYCSTCNTLKVCCHSQCALPVMNYPGACHCFRHTSPDNVLTPECEPWPRCINYTSRRCHKLSQSANESSFCFACASGTTPCCNSHHGCTSYVRNNAQGSKSCAVTCDNRLIRCPHEAPNCIKGCKRKAHPGNGHYCENCRPLKCTKRINNKRPAFEVALFPRPMKPSRMCHWAPTCTRPANASDNLGRCTTCMLYTNPPCENHLLCKQRITTEASSGLCKECYNYGPSCHGSQGQGCRYVKRAKPNNGGLCFKCRHPACPGKLGTPCKYGSLSQDSSGKPCKRCLKGACEPQRNTCAPKHDLTATPVRGPKCRLRQKQPVPSDRNWTQFGTPRIVFDMSLTLSPGGPRTPCWCISVYVGSFWALLEHLQRILWLSEAILGSLGALFGCI